MDFGTFLVQCLNSVQYGLLLFLVASGLTLIFGIMGVINLAHGSFYMIGAYIAFALAPYLGQHFITMLVVGMVLAAALSIFSPWDSAVKHGGSAQIRVSWDAASPISWYSPLRMGCSPGSASTHSGRKTSSSRKGN